MRHGVPERPVGGPGPRPGTRTEHGPGAGGRPSPGRVPGPGFSGDGPLSRAAALVHTLLTVEAMLLAAASPGLVALFFLDRDPAGLPLAAVCLLPLGPALAAALHALHHRGRDLTDLHPARDYWRGWRLNAWPALKLWAGLLTWLTVVAFCLAHFPLTGLPGWWAALLAAAGLAGLLWGAHALVLTSLFAFRTADTYRLAAYFLLRHGRTTLGAASLIVVAAGLTLLATEALPALLAPLLLLSLLHTSRPVITETEEDFTV
ncbi:hypothetical protein GCM10009654_15780 [Streptomyces hebeiensis]|uniref:DUF624 domain-containing protein n=1 Tax=Streptomyces hebeiensis TaxID=229486 RepID=A0ABP4F961_9ACTN